MGNKKKTKYQKLSAANFYSQTSPIKEENPTTTSSINYDLNSDDDWPVLNSKPQSDKALSRKDDASATKETNPPSTSANTDRSSLDSKAHSDKALSRKDADASATNETVPPSTSANTDGSSLDSKQHSDKALSREDVDASATNETIPPIKQEHSATTIIGSPPQDLSTSANTDTDGSLLDDEINGTLPSSSSADKDSSRKDVDAHTDNVDASASSTTNETITPIKQEYSATTSSVTPSQEGLSTEELSKDSSKAASPSANTDWSLPDDGINVTVPSFSYSADKDSSREDVDAHIDNAGASANGTNRANGRPLQDDLTTSTSSASSREDVDAHVDNVDASAKKTNGENGAIPPIKQEHPATTTSMITSNNGGEPLQSSLTTSSSSSSASSRRDGTLQKGLNADAPPFEPLKPCQNSSTAASSSANTEWFLPDDLKPLNGLDTHAGVSGSLTEPAQVSRDIEQYSLHMLKAALNKLPQPKDSERTKSYTARHPSVTPSSYPQVKASIVNNPAFWERRGTDTLFFAFYYEQNTYQQYLAAKELKKQSWKYHKKDTTWYLRHEEPKIVNDEYEQGTYLYFDFHMDSYGWRNRIKTEFKFEYNFLEDEL